MKTRSAPKTQQGKETVLSESIQTPFLFFHILLYCSLMLKSFTLISPLINLHSMPHNDKVKTGS